MAKDETLDRRIQEEIEGRIVSGDWPPGYRIPFEVDLAAQYGCSRMTVNKVLTRLASAGLLERRRRSGTVVTRPVAQSAVLEIHDIESEVKSLNLPYDYQLVRRVQRKFRAADAARLALPPSASILELHCIHLAGRKPFCHEDRIINLDAVPDAAEVDFTGTAPGPWLINQVPWSTAEHLIRAVAAGEDQAKALEIAPGTACLVVERRTWNDIGMITHVRLTYPGDRHALVAQFSPQGARA
ncbi:histidine utilization repressor [Mycoplana dimorpha]|uniref:Histidine utilization repressor n=1 Tax=Mycoplana dimorpha TaxID=28320 RepID=A0A2T5B3P7_MYCDI|nr:GntR family transcriptional regulator [Mycoplana dimorpha]